MMKLIHLVDCPGCEGAPELLRDEHDAAHKPGQDACSGSQCDVHPGHSHTAKVAAIISPSSHVMVVIAGAAVVEHQLRHKHLSAVAVRSLDVLKCRGCQEHPHVGCQGKNGHPEHGYACLYLYVLDRLRRLPEYVL
eukprot:scaffold47347_cov31-Prasinocladus_malaysianus.AAC.2